MAAAKLRASVLSHKDTSEQLYALINDVTGTADGEATLAVLSPINYLLDLYEML